MLGMAGISCARAGSGAARQANRAKRDIILVGMAARLTKLTPNGNRKLVQANVSVTLYGNRNTNPVLAFSSVTGPMFVGWLNSELFTVVTDP
jgi:hypothetical protein